MSSDLRTELEEIRKQHGKLTAQNVVDTARDPAHPMHSRFEWDDSIAGEAYRRQQAADMIRRVRIVYKEADKSGPSRSVRAYHALPDTEGYAYDPAEEIAEDPFRRKLLLDTMAREWKDLYRRYQEFEEFLAMVRHDLGNGGSAAA